ncbi:hypothetical protein D9M69_578100 [compost metagenome]
MTMVSTPGSMPRVLNAESRAMPVMIPGRAMGRISSSEMPSLPKKSRRYSAAAARVPSSRAISVAMQAICSDSSIASSTSARVKATLSQRRVKPLGGKLKAASSVLKA